MDNLILMWKHPETKKNYVIGLLSKLAKRYRFEYVKDEVNKAIRDGFELLIGFPEIDKKYYANKLFPLFERRIPPKSRKVFKDVVEKYNLSFHSDVMWQFLRISQGKTGTDTFSLVEPVKIKDKKLHLEFTVAGWSFLDNRTKACHLLSAPNRKIYLKSEPENPKDNQAVMVYVGYGENREKIGYIPNPYNYPIYKVMTEAPNLVYEARLVRQLDFDEDRPAIYISFPLERHNKLLRDLKKSPYVVT